MFRRFGNWRSSASAPPSISDAVEESEPGERDWIDDSQDHGHRNGENSPEQRRDDGERESEFPAAADRVHAGKSSDGRTCPPPHSAGRAA